MIKKFIAPMTALLVVTLVYGCGNKNDVVGPKTPGDPAALVSTSWSDPASNSVYTFKDANNVECANPAIPTPITGTYTVDAGRVDMTLGLQTLEATWDGKVLAIKGKPLVKQ